MSSVRSAWQQAFVANVIAPLAADPEAAAILNSNDLSAKQELAHRGIVGQDDEARVSLCEAFLYQRAHTDANRDWLTELGVAAATDDLLVVDIGCGAGTVAMAIGEALDLVPDSLVRYRYVGVDHSDHAVGLCSAMLSAPGTIRPEGSWSVHREIDSALFDATNWLSATTTVVVSTSYLFRQGLSDESLEESAAAVTTLLRACQEAGKEQVVLLGVDAVTDSPASRLPDFIDRLAVMGVDVGQRRGEPVVHSSHFCNFRPDQFWGVVVQPYATTPGYPNLDRWVYLVK